MAHDVIEFGASQSPNALGPAPGADTAQPVDIKLVGVSKQYGEVRALLPTDLVVHRGEFFSLLGPSGSGKTTTLRLIAGFEDPTTGSIYLQGKEVSRAAPYERNVNTVFQDYALFPHMSVEDNVGYGLRVKRVPKRERAHRVAEALRMVRLTGYNQRRPSQLSGGQRQRVALARALVNTPAVLLLDEPLGALDLKLRREMQEELKRIQREVGITFIYVTHDQEEAMSMSDRLAVMSDGAVRQVGSPTEVYERPSSAFVAGFVGISNLVEGTVVGHEDGRLVIAIAGDDRLRVSTDQRAELGQAVLVAVRPEKIQMHLGPTTAGGEQNGLRGKIADVSYGGAFTRYGILCGDTQIAVLEQNQGAGPRATRGEEVWLTWRVDQTALVSGSRDDAEAGKRAAAAAPS